MYTVIKRFHDKYDAKTRYEVGTNLDWTDEERIADCVKRGLIKEVEAPKKAPTRTRKPKKETND